MITKLSVATCIMSSLLTMGTYTANADVISDNGNSYVYIKEQFIEQLGFDPTNNHFENASMEEDVSVIQSIDYTTTTIYTPNKTAVTVLKFLSDLSSSEISTINTTLDSYFSAATRLSSATTLYNCHSYAWYCADSSNTYWMNDPSAYYTDGSYNIVSSSSNEITGDVGDIICYYDSNGNNLHSAIIVSKTSDNLSDVTVVSKWGKAGLYRHKANYCPYMPAYGGETSYIASYKHARHTYGSYIKTYNALFHKSYCNCGSYELSSHYIKAEDTTSNYANCVACGTLLDLKNYSYPSITNNAAVVILTENGTYMLPNGVVVVVDDDYESVINGELDINLGVLESFDDIIMIDDYIIEETK